MTYVTVILSNNCLAGPIPNEYANLISISHLDLGGNCLLGTIPDFICQWQLLGQLDLSRYMFTSEFLVVQLKNYFYPYRLVYYLDISDNNRNNSVSLSLSNLYSSLGTGLKTLQIGNNFFYGPLQLDFSLFMFSK